jgi:hypothetical protein
MATACVRVCLTFAVQLRPVARYLAANETVTAGSSTATACECLLAFTLLRCLVLRCPYHVEDPLHWRTFLSA